MTERNDGGPAFPRQMDFNPITNDPEAYAELGMSLRDWFAGQALAGITWNLMDEIGKKAAPRRDRAEQAYKIADAMLEQREETP